MRLIENNELRIFENSIMFSFLPISDSNFSFDVYRRSADGVKAEQEYRYELPLSEKQKSIRDNYFITFMPRNGSVKYICNSQDNSYLTCKWLAYQIEAKTISVFSESDYFIGRKFIPRVSYTIKKTPYGDQMIDVEPYFLKKTNEFGFTLDFRFWANVKGKYSNDLIEYAGRNFSKIRELIKKVEDELPKWIIKSDYETASYYSGFDRFQKEYNYPIRIFSLNYDLCIEKQLHSERIETGFAGSESWDGSRFIHSSDDEPDAPIYLYKLHGSIDWERNKNGLICSQQQGIKPEIVFGTGMKMQAVDPYLFYLYEFRKYALLTKVIIIIGYSFNDHHINDLLKQALEASNLRKLLIVNPQVPDNVFEQVGLSSPDERILIESIGARDFLSSTLSIDYLSSLLPDEKMPF